MNRLLVFTTVIALFLGCTEKQPAPNLMATCGVGNPIRDLPWLNDIVTKADADKATMAYKGNYLGTIYLDKYNDQPVFVIKMMIGSGGIYAYLFGCDGQRVHFDQESIAVTLVTDIEKRNNVLYTNMP